MINFMFNFMVLLVQNILHKETMSKLSYVFVSDHAGLLLLKCVISYFYTLNEYILQKTFLKIPSFAFLLSKTRWFKPRRHLLNVKLQLGDKLAELPLVKHLPSETTALYINEQNIMW